MIQLASGRYRLVVQARWRRAGSGRESSESSESEQVAYAASRGSANADGSSSMQRKPKTMLPLTTQQTERRRPAEDHTNSQRRKNAVTNRIFGG